MVRPMKPKTNTPTIGFITLGCPKNQIDSEKTLGRLIEAGMLISADPDAADVVLINTCGFIAPAKSESLDAIRQAVDHKKQGNVQRVVVLGCLSQRMKDDLFEEVPGIDAVVGLEQRDDIVRIVTEALQSSGHGSYLEVLPGRKPHQISDDRSRLLIGGQHSAYLRISEGCDHRCSFCTIPAIRGPFRSKPQQQVLEEARELAQAGVVELNLVAQDTTSYERDLKHKEGLAHLLQALAEVDGLPWIRLMYIYPTGLSEKLIQVIASTDKLVHYLDIPIQHAHDRILQQMRRPDRQADLRDLMGRLRQHIPDIVLRTTVIVGFPGETEQEFADLVDFVRWARFDALGAFPYYPESGTAAAGLPDQIPEAVKEERLERLMLAQQDIAFAKNRDRLGDTLTCLVDSHEPDNSTIARFYGQAPDIDSVCLLPECSAAPGDFIQARITDSDNYDLIAHQI